MFEYIRNEYNPSPVLVLDPGARPAGRWVRDLPYSRALSFRVPADRSALEACHGRKWWATVRRKERRLRADVDDLRFRVVTRENELRDVLPKVQHLFAERWAGEYTSFCWKTPEGFAPYADAMVDLAADGRAELAVLEGDGIVLSFVYALVEDGCYYFYQHAATQREKYRRHSVGKILVTKLIEDLVERPRCVEFDFMTGESDYKREWGVESRPIVYRIDEPRTVAGAVRFAVRVALVAAKHRVQFGPPRVRTTAKSVLHAAERTRGALSRRS
ncbi:GNAT family N-acetyltransferase [Pseudonocardia sp. C8]|uniref:GNAT family N-acetyltransferase n=1 Tax=Pseudonocardia sp. C8 TaxID=2762759 RepID=UPI001642C17D|nr:GNAT family N-acetyltransferase [Pseudonocardia sp. C8]MBC3193503.1 GNAT family N-acetyltransferase [Pseudonocardia sp. C8]